MKYEEVKGMYFLIDSDNVTQFKSKDDVINKLIRELNYYKLVYKRADDELRGIKFKEDMGR